MFYKIKNNPIKCLLILISFVFVIIILLHFLFEQKYQNKIYPGIYLGDINLSGLTITEAKNLLNQKIRQIGQNGIIFKYNNTEGLENKWRIISVMPIVYSFKDDLVYQIIFFDVQSVIKQAYDNGRDNDFWLNLHNKIQTLIYKKQISIMYKINENEIKKILYENYKEFESSAQNAKLTALPTLMDDNVKKIVFNITSEKLGKSIDYQKAINELKINLAKLDFSSIQLHTKTNYPDIYKNQCVNVETKAQQIISSAPLILMYKKKQWNVEAEQIAQWLVLKKNENNINVELNATDVLEFLKQKIALQIDKDPINARFKIENERAIEFQTSEDGLKLDIEKTLLDIQQDFIINQKSIIQLTVNQIKSDITTENINNLGIKEIVGTGHSNFVGSPANRRHNIKTGVNAIHGLLIKPDEEFSLVKALGEVNAKSGYLPELIIKGNKTIHEYGGGLCQVGTTMFRAALDSGLPITERKNHSYRIFYYEPAGVDAAIYSPHPDIRFINDTKNFVLIQARIIKNNLYFDFWGIKDNRIIEKTNPVIYNIVKPRPVKIIKTTELAVGEKKCIEQPHNGADAYFDYKITYPNGVVKEKRFNSHYVPWQGICLVGVKKE